MSHVDLFVSFWDQNGHTFENIMRYRMSCDVLNMRKCVVIGYYILELTYTALLRHISFVISQPVIFSLDFHQNFCNFDGFLMISSSKIH